MFIHFKARPNYLQDRRPIQSNSVRPWIAVNVKTRSRAFTAGRHARRALTRYSRWIWDSGASPKRDRGAQTTNACGASGVDGYPVRRGTAVAKFAFDSIVVSFHYVRQRLIECGNTIQTVNPKYEQSANTRSALLCVTHTGMEIWLRFNVRDVTQRILNSTTEYRSGKN